MIPQPTLRARLERFSIGPTDAALTFTQRVARENGWSLAFAERVEREYKRFVYLAMTAGHPVTPSDEVDQCWHLHLTYTRSYWDEMCGEVLGRPLHHGPTAGGAAESRKYREWYENTLASYEREFGTPPPRDIWPSADQRFYARYRRVELGQHVVVSRGVVAGGMTMAVFLLFAACAGDTTSTDSLLATAVAVGLIALLLLMVSQVWRGAVRHGGDREQVRRERAGRGDDTARAGAFFVDGGGTDRKTHDFDDADGFDDAGGDSGCGGGGGCGGGCGGD